jgi:ppGpp synthetase/RelA/SpoT-type nucleotidyltranferase
MPISISELTNIQSKWQERYADYEHLSDYISERCLAFQRKSPKMVRIVFSREPKVKTLSSITQKIEARRKDPLTANFRYEDLTDIVAHTVLCPYASDVKQFIGWVKQAFDVHTADVDAYKEYESGHRGYHFVITPTVAELVNEPHYDGIKCELQLKTLLQEAFDAKSHDLAYKPGHLEVGHDLLTQFVLLSSALNAIDGQSEFLKRLILREQQDLELRRRACLELYLRNYGDMPDQLGLNPDKLPDVVAVAHRLKDSSGELLSGEFCKFAAYCALKLDHAFLMARAIEYTDQWIAKNTADVHRVFIRGSIKWVLGKFESSFDDFLQVIDRSARGEAADPDDGMRAKNNLIYAVCDCKMFKHDVDNSWLTKIAPYVEELSAAKTGNEADTIGFYFIMFGETPEKIEEGRRRLRISRQNRSDPTDAEIYTSFFNLHEYVALTRLLAAAKSLVNY